MNLTYLSSFQLLVNIEMLFNLNLMRNIFLSFLTKWINSNDSGKISMMVSLCFTLILLARFYVFFSSNSLIMALNRTLVNLPFVFKEFILFKNLKKNKVRSLKKNASSDPK